MWTNAHESLREANSPALTRTEKPGGGAGILPCPESSPALFRPASRRARVHLLTFHNFQFLYFAHARARARAFISALSLVHKRWIATRARLYIACGCASSDARASSVRRRGETVYANFVRLSPLPPTRIPRSNVSSIGNGLRLASRNGRSAAIKRIPVYTVPSIS